MRLLARTEVEAISELCKDSQPDSFIDRFHLSPYIYHHDTAKPVFGSEVLTISEIQGFARMEECRQHWQSGTGQLMSDSTPTARYYAEKQRDRGAAATLALLELSRHSDSRGVDFRATTIGDSSIVVHRKRQNESRFDLCLPVDATDLFENPQFLCSNEQLTPTALSLSAAARSSGTLVPGDLVLMVTDALARWYLGDTLDLVEARAKRLKVLRRLLEGSQRQRTHRFFDAKADQSHVRSDSGANEIPGTLDMSSIDSDPSRRKATRAGVAEQALAIFLSDEEGAAGRAAGFEETRSASIVADIGLRGMRELRSN